MSELQLINGLVWPAHDTQCAKVIFDEVAALEHVYPYVTNWDAVVQAGGNCGVFAMALAKKFGTVYSFEPDHDNFVCLAHNCSHDANVICLQAALGKGSEPPISMDTQPGNCGAHMVGKAGHIPVLSIDSLNLPSCGLMTLDVEGYEVFALQGAQKTLARCRPVLLLEMKGIGAKYGWPDEELHFWLTEGFQYRLETKLLRDRLYVPA